MGKIIPDGIHLNYLDEEKLNNIGPPLKNVPNLLCILQGRMSEDFIVHAILSYLISYYKNMVMTENEIFDYLVVLKNSFSFFEESRDNIVYEIHRKFCSNPNWKPELDLMMILSEICQEESDRRVWDWDPPTLSVFDPRKRGRI